MFAPENHQLHRKFTVAIGSCVIYKRYISISNIHLYKSFFLKNYHFEGINSRNLVFVGEEARCKEELMILFSIY